MKEKKGPNLQKKVYTYGLIIRNQLYQKVDKNGNLCIKKDLLGSEPCKREVKDFQKLLVKVPFIIII